MTPAITNVSGTITTGQTLTITGTTMMDEDNTNWLAMFKEGTAYGFEGTGYVADGYGLAPDEIVYGTGGYDASVKLHGSKSIYGNVTSALKTGYGFYHDVSGTGFYQRFYTRWHSSGAWKWPDNYIKMAMNGGSASDQMYFQASGTDGSVLPTTMTMVYDSAGHEVAVSNFLTDNRWYCIEIRYRTTSSPIFTCWVDGVVGLCS